MATIPTPNMSLPVPAVGSENGPQFAIDINNCMSIIDGHNHTPGSGVQIPTAGLNINTSLSFQGNSITNLGSSVFTPGPLLSVVDSVYVGGVDLYYTDGNGNQIQLTKAGNVNAVIASIPGESYSGGTFTWVQGAGSTTPALFDIASITIRPTAAGTTNGVVVNPPSAISSEYSIYLPALPSITTQFLTIDTGGNIVGSISTSGGITGSNIAAATITGSNIAAATITGSNIAAATITPNNLTSANVVLGANTGVIGTESTSPVNTGSSAAITVSGVRPVLVFIQSTATSASNSFNNLNDPGDLWIYKNGSPVSVIGVGAHTGSEIEAYDAPSLVWIDVAAATLGTPSVITYTLYYSSSGVGTGLSNVQIVAIEL